MKVQVNPFAAGARDDAIEDARKVLETPNRHSLTEITDAAEMLALASRDETERRWASTIVNIADRGVRHPQVRRERTAKWLIILLLVVAIVGLITG